MQTVTSVRLLNSQSASDERELRTERTFVESIHPSIHPAQQSPPKEARNRDFGCASSFVLEQSIRKKQWNATRKPPLEKRNSLRLARSDGLDNRGKSIFVLSAVQIIQFERISMFRIFLTYRIKRTTFDMSSRIKICPALRIRSDIMILNAFPSLPFWRMVRLEAFQGESARENRQNCQEVGMPSWQQTNTQSQRGTGRDTSGFWSN